MNNNTSLRKLSLADAKFTKEEKEQLFEALAANPPLEELNLSGTTLSPSDFSKLARLKQLKKLDISELKTKIASKKLDWLEQQLPNCKVVR